MIINQCRMSEGMRDKFSYFYTYHNLVEYRDKRKPVLFYGLYLKKDIEALMAHKSLAIIIWRGSDVLKFNNKQLREISKKNIRHIAISNCIVHDLSMAGIDNSKFRFIPLIGSDINGISVEPLGKEVYAYVPDSKKKKLFFNENIVKSIARKIPFKINIISSSNMCTREQLLEIYKRCFIGLRLSIHDGIANQVVEMGLMGRRVVHNNSHPNAIPWNCEEDVIKAIMSESKCIGSIKEETAKQVREYITVKYDWLTTEFWGYR